MEKLEKLLSVRSAAEALGGVSTWTIYAWLKAGRLQKTKVGRRTMIRESELARFVEQCNHDAASPAEKEKK